MHWIWDYWKHFYFALLHLHFTVVPVCSSSCQSHFVAREASWCKTCECTSISQSNCINIISVLPVRWKVVQVSKQVEMALFLQLILMIWLCKVTGKHFSSLNDEHFWYSQIQLYLFSIAKLKIGQLNIIESICILQNIHKEAQINYF